MKLSEIKANPNNPRVIKDDRFKKLCQSIEEFPKMMKLRPMVVDANNIVLGGNQRLKALQHLGYKEIPDEWVKRADELTDEEQKRFIAVDNVGYGEWDWDVLTSDWDTDELEDWGVEVPEWVSSEKIESINEMEEWSNLEAPNFEPKENEIKLSLYFQTEQQRKEFVDNNNIEITKNQGGQWVSRMK